MNPETSKSRENEKLQVTKTTRTLAKIGEHFKAAEETTS